MFAEIVIDIRAKEVDRPFTYAIPEDMRERVRIGSPVSVPFGAGNRRKKGYVIGFSDRTSLPPQKIKQIAGLEEERPELEEQMISLAAWIRDRYGGTFYQALQLTLPANVKTEPKREREFVFTGTGEKRLEYLKEAERKKHYARKRLLEAFAAASVLPAEIVTDRLNISSSTIKWFTDQGIMEIRLKDASSEKSEGSFRRDMRVPVLNEEQKQAVNGIRGGRERIHVLFGVTGSGKTEVYLQLIDEVIREGKDAIVLIPEIALTYQTVMRFYERFGGLVSVVHSRISKGEKCERFRKAKEGKVRIMIGPRSALFTPFQHLGLIVIDEFHENSYISEQVPRYHAVETAIKRAEASDAKLVLGSATPSVEIYGKALRGEYGLHVLRNRAVKGSFLPKVTVVDMRKELEKKNRSVFSELLREKITDRLRNSEQIMLFLNRRGYSGAVSCRSCGKPITCPHCSVSMNFHRNGTMVCHLCGYERPLPKFCPDCGSHLLGTFGIGTEKVEEAAANAFPGARILRMDADTTKGKNGHEEILERFRNEEADILIGTQMIVKGHDFRNVTLVGILAADLSLNVPDYRSSERTFQLLAQAEGRAGRGEKEGECIVQTYVPEHYAIRAAAEQDYSVFYENEMLYRNQMKYPPAGFFMELTVSGGAEEVVHEAIRLLHRQAGMSYPDVSFLGPAEAPVHKVKDMYREVLYLKSPSLERILLTKHFIEENAESGYKGKIYLSFDM